MPNFSVQSTIYNSMDRLDGMTEGLHKARSGLIRVLLRKRSGRIEDIIISGDFILTPEKYIDEMERSLVGTEAEREKILSTLAGFFAKNKFQSPQTYPEDFAEAIMKALERQDG